MKKFILKDSFGKITESKDDSFQSYSELIKIKSELIKNDKTYIELINKEQRLRKELKEIQNKRINMYIIQLIGE